MKTNIEYLEAAIDALVDLEGTEAYPHGLSDDIRRALSDLRSRRTRAYQDEEDPTQITRKE